MHYTVPSGYKGLRSKLEFKTNSKLAVITGLNGSGKTTFLTYIFEKYSKSENIFFKTQSSKRRERSSYLRNRILRRNYLEEIPTFDQIMDSVYREFERFTRDTQYTHRYEVFSMLFDEGSYLYKDRHMFLNRLCIELSQLDDEDNIKEQLGIPTEKEIDASIIDSLNKKIKSNEFDSQCKQGKLLYDEYKDKKISDNDRQIIEKVKDKIIPNILHKKQKNSKVQDRQSFEKYIHDLVLNFSFSIESIIEKMSQRIYEDVKGKKSDDSKLWENINAELSKYQETYFKYRINPPSLFSSSYEINFQPIDGSNKEIHFDSLSSGEKVVFELLCYYLIANKDSKIDLMILDEFDANLNPALVEIYLDIIRTQFCNKDINVILTTHSPSTVAELKPEELFELSLDNGQQKIVCANDAAGKKEILKKLAPKFVYYSEFGNLEYVLRDHSNTIVFLEGKKDSLNFSESDDCTYVPCDGAGNIESFLKCFNVIPILKNIASHKLIIALFDFDIEGRRQIQHILDDTPTSNDSLAEKITKGRPPYVHWKNNIYLAMLQPPEDRNWNYKDTEYRHQEMKNEGKKGIERQTTMINQIEKEYQEKQAKS